MQSRENWNCSVSLISLQQLCRNVWGGFIATFDKEMKLFLESITSQHPAVDAAVFSADLQVSPRFGSGPPAFIFLMYASVCVGARMCTCDQGDCSSTLDFCLHRDVT